MVTIAVSLRYHAKTDTYYIQVQGEQYDRLDKKVRHLAACMERMQDERQSAERARLAEYRRRLLQEKRRSQYYIVVPASDVPENVRARPIYDITGEIVTAEPKRYAELLNRLQKSKNKGDES